MRSFSPAAAASDSFVLPGKSQPAVPACQVLVTWIPGSHLHARSLRMEASCGPGLAGRIYLYGEQIDCPLVTDGSLVVSLYNALSGPEFDKGPPLEEWRIDKDTLKRLQRRDAVRWGYTIFLPWGTYKPELSQVQLRVRFEPVKGTPLYAESSTLVLQKRAPGGMPAPSSQSTKPLFAFNPNPAHC